MDIQVAVVDRLSEILTAIYAASEKRFKPVRLKPHRRPETAMDRARRKAKQAKHRSVTERVRVHKSN